MEHKVAATTHKMVRIIFMEEIAFIIGHAGCLERDKKRAAFLAALQSGLLSSYCAAGGSDTTAAVMIGLPVSAS